MSDNYDYGKAIKTTGEMGIGSSPTYSQLKANIRGLSNYTKVLTVGNRNSIKTGGHPLGNAYFLDTKVKCKPKNKPKNEVKLYTYVNNMSTGKYDGLIFSIIDNVKNMNPMKLMSNTKSQLMNNQCVPITLPVIKQLYTGKHKVSYDTKHVSIGELNNIKAGLCKTTYKSKLNKYNKNICNEGFINMNEYLDYDMILDKRNDIKNSGIDLDIKLYHSFIGILLLYCVYKVTH